MHLFPSARRVFVLFLMLLAMPGALPGTASAQSTDICGEAIASAESGTGPYANYTVAYGSGGAGRQIVLGTEESETLTGGSGNDVLCGYGSDDILEGGSGSDILVGGAGIDELYGGSGNDTLYGTRDEILNGGSGRSEIIAENPNCQAARDWAYTADHWADRPSLAGIDLSGCDLSGQDLGSANLGYATLSGADLSGANLAGASLFQANLTNANLSGADLTGANFYQATCPDGYVTEEFAGNQCAGHF